MFFAREEELNELQDLYDENKFQLVIMYGRRRVGKTSIIKEFCKDKAHIFYVAQEYNNTTALKDFSHAVMNYQGMKVGGMSFETWEAGFGYLAELAKEQRIVVAIDEFPYLAEANRSVPSIIQNAVDHTLRDTKLFIILCGSSMAFMEKEVLGYKSPLYGRRTAQIKVMPFDYYDSCKFFDSDKREEALTLYGILGGIPQYLLEFNNLKSLEDNILKSYLRKSALLYSEPINLLKQEVREPMIYNSIIGAIAQGASRLNDISTKIGEKPDKCAIYIRSLDELGIVKKMIPAGEKESSKRTIYTISDYMFRFWFRFIYPNLSSIELGLQRSVVKNQIIPQLSNYMGLVFEDICMQFLIRKNKEEKLAIQFTKIGRWWGSDPVKKQEEEIDIIAQEGDRVIFGECKWRNEATGMEVLNRLKERSYLFAATERYYAIFSKSGFTEQLISYAQMHSENVSLYGIDDLFV